jgi:hypothetical protein
MGHRDIRATIRYTQIADIKSIKVNSPLDELFQGAVRGEEVLK